MTSFQQIYLRCVHVELSRPSEQWVPALNAYQNDDGILFCVELAGVKPSGLHVSAEPRHLIIRGTREPLMKNSDAAGVSSVLALEIDEGAFERRVPLPNSVDCSRVHAQLTEGILRIFLPFAKNQEVVL